MAPVEAKRYFKDNTKISLEDFMKEVRSMETQKVVQAV
jgi:hypothetical protein